MPKALIKAAVSAGMLFTNMNAALAEETDPASSEVGDIVVTAQRRSERLQDVPMAITSLGAVQLEKAGITSTADLPRLAPSVSMPFYGAFLQPAIRGVSSTGANIGDNSNVAMYIDGVYQPQQIATLIDLPDVQQIDILKGPQGALYGQNATGGAILVTTAEPMTSLEGRISASFGNYNAVDVRGYVSGPINEDISVSFASGYQDRNGFRRQLITEKRDKGLTSKVARGKLLLTPSDAAKITVTGYYSDRSDSAQYSGFAIADNSIGYLFVPTAPKVTRSRQYGTREGVYAAIKSYGGNIRGEVETDIGTISSVTALTRNRINYLSDVDYSPVDYGESYTDNLYANYFTQESNFVSRAFGAVSFIAGGLYLNGTESFDPGGFRLRTTVFPTGGLSAVTFNQNKYQRLDKEIFAVYGELTVKATTDLTLTAGGRFTHETQRGYSSFILPAPNSATIVERPGGSVSFSKFSPRVTARYALTASSNVYASWGQGFKSGVINTTNLAQTPVKPEVITSYEVGYKGRIADGLTANLAAFYYDYKNLQVVAFSPPTYLQQNAASARIKGIDADISWNVAPGLTLSGGAAYLDARYRRFPAAQVFRPSGAGGNIAVTTDLSGKRMLRSPKFSGNVGVNYDLDTTIGRFGAFASLYYNSGYGFELSNRLRTGAYATADAELSFAPTAFEGVRFVLWGRNLGDRNYLSGALTSQLGDGGTYANPRTAGVRAEFAF